MKWYCFHYIISFGEFYVLNILYYCTKNSCVPWLDSVIKWGLTVAVRKELNLFIVTHLNPFEVMLYNKNVISIDLVRVDRLLEELNVTCFQSFLIVFLKSTAEMNFISNFYWTLQRESMLSIKALCEFFNDRKSWN